MKKIFTLLVLLMTTLCVSAQQYYKGTFHSKLNDFKDYETTVAVTQGEGGKYTLVFESVIFGNDDFGKCTFAGIENYKWAGNGNFTFLTKAATSAQLQNTISSCLTTLARQLSTTRRYISHSATSRLTQPRSI